MHALSDTWITVDNAAKRLAISPSQLRRLCAQHNIGKKFGHMWRLSLDDIGRLRLVRHNHPVGVKHSQ